MSLDNISNALETSQPDGEHYSVVIADDDGPMAELLAINLQQLGHKVLGIARNGKETVELAFKCCPDVLILDIEMPLVDGLKAAGIIRNSRLAPIPIVIASGLSDARSIFRAIDLKIVSYLIKPFNSEQLNVALHLAVSQGRQQAALPRDDFDSPPASA